MRVEKNPKAFAYRVPIGDYNYLQCSITLRLRSLAFYTFVVIFQASHCLHVIPFGSPQPFRIKEAFQSCWKCGSKANYCSWKIVSAKISTKLAEKANIDLTYFIVFNPI